MSGDDKIKVQFSIEGKLRFFGEAEMTREQYDDLCNESGNSSSSRGHTHDG
jgi:hypothetical protein